MRQTNDKMAKRIRISNETLNCYGTWIRTEGIDLTQFSRNPVLLWMHQRGVVIGMIKDIRVADGEVTGEPWFDEVREESRLAKQQWEKGTLRMGSPNFEILETSEDAALLKPGQTRPTVTRCKLMEYSMVDIGGNDDNIRLSYEGREIRLDAGGGCNLPLLKDSANDNNKTLQTMNEQLKTIALMLGLADTATLPEVQKQINVLLGYQTANTSLRAEKEKLEKELDTLRLAGITQLVDEAVTSGKIEAGKKAHFIELGKKVGQESLKLTFEAMHGTVKPSMVLNRTGSHAATGEWKKLSEVPVEELKLMRENDPQQYRKLYKAEYGIDCPGLN